MIQQDNKILYVINLINDEIGLGRSRTEMTDDPLNLKGPSLEESTLLEELGLGSHNVEHIETQSSCVTKDSSLTEMSA